MLTFSFVKESRQAANYYEETDDYYTKEGHRGEWDGNGAEALGLEGGVDREVFKSLLEGRLPDGTQVRKPAPKTSNGKKANARLGIDFTFSAPKSVSIVALVANDRRVIEAHDAAVKDALGLMESKVVARQKIKGISFREHTNNFVVAKFQHDLSRDQDPQLHTHAIAMNLTQRKDGRWTALANEEMLKGVKVVGAYYRAQLAQRLQDMGYEIRATRDGFEMASVSDDAIKMFSQRSRSIEDQLSAQGLTRDSATGGQKQTITKNTRKRKTESDRKALRQERGRARPTPARRTAHRRTARRARKVAAPSKSDPTRLLSCSRQSPVHKTAQEAAAAAALAIVENRTSKHQKPHNGLAANRMQQSSGRTHLAPPRARNRPLPIIRTLSTSAQLVSLWILRLNT
jgi:conjugative relaxase-like TrwC/TraI family protein